jgi:hypothetical protein
VSVRGRAPSGSSTAGYRQRVITPPISPPSLTFFARATVTVAEPIDIGLTHEGERRVVPITGGFVEAEGWSGKVLAFGADFQRYPSSEVALLEARYVIETDDGSHIVVENSAVRSGSAADLRSLMSGDPVDPARIYFRCVPRLHTAMTSPHAWVNGRVFVGTGRRNADTVVIDIFALN